MEFRFRKREFDITRVELRRITYFHGEISFTRIQFPFTYSAYGTVENLYDEKLNIRCPIYDSRVMKAEDPPPF